MQSIDSSVKKNHIFGIKRTCASYSSKTVFCPTNILKRLVTPQTFLFATAPMRQRWKPLWKNMTCATVIMNHLHLGAKRELSSFCAIFICSSSNQCSALLRGFTDKQWSCAKLRQKQRPKSMSYTLYMYRPCQRTRWICVLSRA
jgi:hypothetical protein